MSFVNIIIISSSIINILLGFFIFSKNKKNLENIYLSFFVFNLALWGISLVLLVVNHHIMWGRATFFFTGLAYLFYLLFIKEFLKNTININKTVWRLFFIFALVVIIISPTSLIEVETIETSEINAYGGVDIVLGYAYPLVVFYYIITFIYAILLMLRAYLSSRGLIKIQMKYLFLGMAIFTLAALVTNLILPYLGIFDFNGLGPTFSVIFIASIAYAITRYRLMGIRVLFSNIFVYAVLILLTEIVFYFSLVVSTALFKNLWSLQALIFNIFVAILFVFLFIRILRYSRLASDIIFYHGKNPQHIVEDLVFEFNQIVDINKLSKLLENKLNQVIETEKVSTVFCIYSCKSAIKIFNKANFPKLKNNDLVLLKDYLSKNKKIIIREELEGAKKVNQKEHAKMINLLNKNGISVVVPLEYHKDIIGYILLGDKEDYDFFASEEISFLDVFSKQIASAFMDAYLYSNMKKEVARQTKELKDKNEHLKKLLKMRSEFLDIVSHQLRTPVSVIKGMLSMVLEGSVPPKKKKEFLEGSFKKSIKLGQIINDILRASEIDTDEGFKLKLKKTDVAPILEDIYEDKKLEIEDKDLKFKLELPKKKLPMILTEESYLRQAIENLINNSAQYTKKGFIKLKAKEEDGFLVIKVSDTGIGIPERDKAKLFKKFARADNAVNVYTDGSGLGLFIAKKIIDAHHDAEIYIEESELNKGTTFAIKIPAIK